MKTLRNNVTTVTNYANLAGLMPMNNCVCAVKVQRNNAAIAYIVSKQNSQYTGILNT